jgi:hypothetical protein
MNCNYIREHEIIDAYLLGRLNRDEKEVFEAHVQDCPVCREHLEQRRAIITGIRMAAYDEMKNGLRRQISKLRDERPETDWTVVFKIAAVVLFFTLLPGLIYYHYYPGNVSPEGSFREMKLSPVAADEETSAANVTESALPTENPAVIKAEREIRKPAALSDEEQMEQLVRGSRERRSLKRRNDDKKGISDLDILLEGKSGSYSILERSENDVMLPDSGMGMASGGGTGGIATAGSGLQFIGISGAENSPDAVRKAVTYRYAFSDSNAGFDSKADEKSVMMQSEIHRNRFSTFIYTYEEKRIELNVKKAGKAATQRPVWMPPQSFNATITYQDTSLLKIQIDLPAELYKFKIDELRLNLFGIDSLHLIFDDSISYRIIPGKNTARIR